MKTMVTRHGNTINGVFRKFCCGSMYTQVSLPERYLSRGISVGPISPSTTRAASASLISDAQPPISPVIWNTRPIYDPREPQSTFAATTGDKCIPGTHCRNHLNQVTQSSSAFHVALCCDAAIPVTVAFFAPIPLTHDVLGTRRTIGRHSAFIAVLAHACSVASTTQHFYISIASHLPLPTRIEPHIEARHHSLLSVLIGFFDYPASTT